jgi:fructose-1,6-bisphosphatase/inositol monophosphatase family enzyme
MSPDPARVAAIISDIAREEIAAKYRRLERQAVRAKAGPSDLVTDVDEAAERALRKALLALAPGAAFIGEETAAADPDIVAKLAEADSAWIVDPLDGTRNFVNGIDEFGVIIAYVEKGAATGGWIYAIPDDAMAIAIRGDGATYRGRPVKARRQQDEIPSGLRSTGWLRPPWRAKLVDSLQRNVRSRSGHCSAYGYLKLLCGEVDFKLSSRIHPWDHAAGALLLEEAGGEVRWLDSAEPYLPQPSRDHPLLATAPGRDWRAIADLLLD